MGRLHLRGDEIGECCKYRGGAKSSPHQQDEKRQQKRRTLEGLEREERGFKFL